MSDPAAYGKLKFGPFELSIGERLLRREGVVLPLGSRALDILIYLAERPASAQVSSSRSRSSSITSGRT